jgi:hypothetical protein
MLPAPLTVRVFPLSVPGPEETLNVTAKPEVAVAVRVIGLTPKTTVIGGAGFQVIVCACPVTVSANVPEAEL